MSSLALIPMVALAYAFSLLACTGAIVMFRDRPLLAIVFYLVMAIAPAIIVTLQQFCRMVGSDLDERSPRT